MKDNGTVLLPLLPNNNMASDHLSTSVRSVRQRKEGRHGFRLIEEVVLHAFEIQISINFSKKKLWKRLFVKVFFPGLLNLLTILTLGSADLIADNATKQKKKKNLASSEESDRNFFFVE